MKKIFNCFFCNKTIEEEDPIEIRCSIPWFKMCACTKCVRKNLLEWKRKYIMHDGILWTRDSRPDIRECQTCWKLFIPSDKAVEFYKDGSLTREQCRCFKCMKWATSHEIYCFECKGYHKAWEHFTKWMAHNFSTRKTSSWYINFSWSKDSKSWMTNWTETICYQRDKQNELRKLPFQEIRELPDDIIREIDRFYWDYDITYYSSNPVKHYTTHYNYRDDIEINWQLTLKFGSFEEDLKKSMFTDRDSYYYGWRDPYTNEDCKLLWMKNKDLKIWIKQNKYRNMYFDSIDDDWYVVWKFIDIFGNLRTKKESVNVFYQAQWLAVDNNSATMKLRYRLSSNLHHKLDAFLRNDQWNFNSCQRAGNHDSLSRWAYDTITNGCVCPILIYKTSDNSRAVWRITTRIMYDKDWEMYILLERLYHDWSFSKQTEKWEVYRAIVMDLKAQWYNVIASNYSAHDESTLNYIESLWIPRRMELRNLYQPLRQLFRTWPANNDKRCWYYADGWTECLSDEIDGIRWTTDYLDKAYLL